ncbi:hypothetical protein ACFQE0_27400 [Methylobacterium komagatae]|uniref:SPOR domain-containing protein n=1 Tax=Methylobacterium komagatae TaxID=374425 RepID=A0ABW2BUH8_9HYPH
MSDRPRRWRGFASLNGPDGPLIWGTLRRTEDEARKAFERHNPMRPVVIVPVELRITGSAETLPTADEEN